jgi:hypothetical protein
MNGFKPRTFVRYSQFRSPTQRHTRAYLGVGLRPEIAGARTARDAQMSPDLNLTTHRYRLSASIRLQIQNGEAPRHLGRDPKKPVAIGKQKGNSVNIAFTPVYAVHTSTK